MSIMLSHTIYDTVLQMAGSLQFVRRWVVFGRVLHQACSEICGVALMFLLLLLLFSHTGSLVFYSITPNCYF